MDDVVVICPLNIETWERTHNFAQHLTEVPGIRMLFVDCRSCFELKIDLRYRTRIHFFHFTFVLVVKPRTNIAKSSF